jgi:hypothetical protein
MTKLASMPSGDSKIAGVTDSAGFGVKNLAADSNVLEAAGVRWMYP